MTAFKTKLIRCAVAGLIAGVTSLVLARAHPFGDAGLYAARAEQIPIMEYSSVPADVRAILASKCADCHSTQTRAPIYGRFAPVSWLMERDIVDARKAMNLSLWETYSAVQQQTFAAQIAHETNAHQMPVPQYLVIHWNARVNDSEVDALADWAHGLAASGSDKADPTSVQGDPTRGAPLFEKRCTGCHSLTQNHQGPRLQGVYGRTSGSITDYAYSQALKRSKIVWDQTTLNKWLKDPDALIPGNEMDFLVSKPQERLDLIAFLKMKRS